MTKLTAQDYAATEQAGAKLPGLPVIIDAPGEYLTRYGTRVTIHEIKPQETATFNCKGTLWMPSKKPGGKAKPEYNIWHPSGRFRPVGESMFDVVAKVE